MTAKTNTENVASRFMARCQGDFTQGINCVYWRGAVDSSGYGQFRLFGVVTGAHRVSYELFISKIPVDLQVLHTCDSVTCVNPAHLWLGTNADNLHDRNVKDRDAHKVTAEQVREIRADQRSQAILANIYGINQSQISRIKSGARRRVVT